MRYILKDYQEDAVREVLQKLTRAKRNFEFDGTPSAFALSATTGAGKTVMAAAVIEAIFEGREDDLFEPDPNATILWFSDDPSLNEQSRRSLTRASEPKPSSPTSPQNASTPAWCTSSTPTNCRRMAVSCAVPKTTTKRRFSRAPIPPSIIFGTCCETPPTTAPPSICFSTRRTGA